MMDHSIIVNKLAFLLVSNQFPTSHRHVSHLSRAYTCSKCQIDPRPDTATLDEPAPVLLAVWLLLIRFENSNRFGKVLLGEIHDLLRKA